MAEKLRRKVGVSNGQTARTQEPVAQSSSRAVAQSERLTDGETDRLPEVGKRKGINVKRYFTRPGVHPFAEVEWEKRSAVISGEKGEVVFEQHDVEIPKSWSQLATNVVASKYFRGSLGTPQREHSVRQLIGRVVETLTGWGRKDGYFASEEDAQVFADELTHLLVEQKLAFNSPVWFNVGVEPEGKAQCSACFILSVEDTMESILDWYRKEGLIFKGGSGSGVNLSKIRSCKERLAGGGMASGPVSFMRAADASAGVIKSGGKTRRAAKMVVLNADHPDLVEFIQCKAEEERKAQILIEAGYDASIDGAAYSSICFQNANNSVRTTDDFMRAILENRPWSTRFVTTGEICETFQARDLLRQLAEATWRCGDPGMQFDTTINAWHTCPNSGRINASNPCVTGDTLIATAEGWQRIDALVGKPARIIGADGQPHFVTKIFPTGRKPVYHLKTRAGYEVRITADHKVLTVNRGDVQVRELAVDDRLYLQGPGFGRRTLSERMGLALGVAVGDGCLVRTVHASGIQEIIILTMAADEAGVLRKIAGEINAGKQLLAATGGDGRNCTAAVNVRTGGTSTRLAFSSREVVALFKELAVLDEGSEQKRFLPSVFELDRPSQAAVLRGLFTADGTVANYGEKSQYISLDSCSIELLRQAQLLLLGFGIKAKLYENRRNNVTTSMLPDGKGGTKSYPVKEMYSLRISRASRMIFEREIGFDLESPKARALAAMNAEVSSYRDELTDAVVAIEPLGEEEVFDLTEPVTEHFVANGLIVHNCSEYMHLDDSACNLASLNLLKFLKDDGGFDTAAFKQAVDVSILAQDIIVDNSSYPTPEITATAKAFRELGLGYANLGAVLMSLGLPYDSEAGRQYAAAITALMTGEAYLQSARLAEQMGSFSGYAVNREPMLGVIDKHRSYAHKLDPALVPLDLLSEARKAWDEALALGRKGGYRNSQVSVLAPTGTIAFMMDCDTTGVEPDIALIKYKRLVGGGLLKIVNHTVPRALKRLGYDSKEVQAVVEYLDEHETIEGAPALHDEHLPVFDCAFKPARGSRSIHYLGHLRMMGAVQPFISGAISKCVVRDTLLATANGLIRIGSLYRGEASDSFRDEILQVASLNGTQETDAFYYGGERAVRSVVLRSGHRVTGTHNHRLLVAGDSGLIWKRLDEIEGGDMVATQYGAELWSSRPARFDDFTPSAPYGSQKDVRVPKEMTEELAFLLGAYAAEGHTARTIWTVHITNSVPAVLDRVAAAWRDLFGIEARITQNGDRCPQVSVASKTVVEFLDYLGCGARASNKRIPNAVLQSPRTMVLAFLQGLALDAYVSVNSMPKWAICLDSPGLLDDLQAVLTNLGVVHSRIAKYNKDYDKTYGEVYAVGEHAQRLASLVPFLEPDKAARAAELARRTINGEHNTADVVPGISPRSLYALLPQGKSGRNGFGVRGEFAYLCDDRTQAITRRTLERVADVEGVRLPRWLLQILNDNLHFSPVESVSDAGVREVFDVSVPATHAFVANGIVNHNTVNLPTEATVEDIAEAYIEAWRLGLKAVAIYRDGCKQVQPLGTSQNQSKTVSGQPQTNLRPVLDRSETGPQRRHLPIDRQAICHKFEIAGHEGYIHVGFYEDGTPGEIFIKMAKEGSTISGLMDTIATLTSLALQYGVPLEALVSKFSHVRFEPSGFTKNPDIPYAKSLTDYIFRFLGIRFLSVAQKQQAGLGAETEIGDRDRERDPAPSLPWQAQADAPSCADCGAIMIRNGSCYKCLNCGATSGCS